MRHHRRHDRPTAPAAEDTAPAAPEPTQPSDTTPATTQARTRDTAPATTAAGGEPQAQAEESEEPDGSAEPADNGTQADENGAADVSEAEDEKTDEPEADSEDEDTGAQDETEAGVRPEADTTPRTKIDEYRRLFDALTVAPEIAGGYDRSLFKHWTDTDKDGCDTRKEVLLAEAIRAPQIGTRCALSGGEWLSRYDGKTTNGTGSGFDVDHLVPLQEAWQSGARDWEPALREHFANFLDYRDALVAVSASSNRSKRCRQPAEHNKCSHAHQRGAGEHWSERPYGERPTRRIRCLGRRRHPTGPPFPRTRLPVSRDEPSRNSDREPAGPAAPSRAHCDP